MKTPPILFLFISLFFVSSSFAETPTLPKVETIKTYYQNGQVRSEKDYKDGILDGTARFYSEKGELQSEEIYNDGRFVGLSKETEAKQEALEMKEYMSFQEKMKYYEDLKSASDGNSQRKFLGQYLNFLKKDHYYLDNQQFSEVTCQASAKMNLQTGVGPISGSVDFLLNYRRSEGVKINNEVYRDWGKYEEEIKSAYSHWKNAIEEAFLELILPKKVTVLKFSENQGSVSAEVESDMGLLNEKYSNNERYQEGVVMMGYYPGALIRNAQFEEKDNNLFLKSLDGTVSFNERNERMKNTLGISYQKINHIYFPQGISFKYVSEEILETAITASHDTHIAGEISLDQCKASE